MLITREMEYALRILRALYRGEQLSATAIAQREHMSKAVTLKILKRRPGRQPPGFQRRLPFVAAL